MKNSLLNKGLLAGYWDKTKLKSSWNAWAGLSFEAICYEHIPQISRALKIKAQHLCQAPGDIAQRKTVVILALK